MQSGRRNKRKRILVLCPHPVGYAPGQRLKYEQYFPAFEANGYDVVVSPFMTESFQKIVYKKGMWMQKILWTIFGYLRRCADMFRVRSYDAVYVFLWVAPFAPPVFEMLTRKLAKKLIYDIDDLVFLIPPSSANPLIHYLRSPKNHIYMMKHADHVITCTPYLDKFVRKYNQKTTDISSTINTTLYKPRTDYSMKGTCIIGWSGSHSTSKYLHLLDNVLRELSKTHKFKLLVMGDPEFSIDGVECEAIPWKESYEVETLMRFDIGLYPIPDEEWVLGKSGLKALQYMALGIPTIASAIGTNFRVIKDGENGFLVKNDEEWLMRLKELISDQELRNKIGSNSAVWVENNFSVRANTKTYLDILENVTAGNVVSN